MRSIACAVSMLAATAWAQGTTLRAEPADAPTVASAQTVSPRQRLLEIDQELDGLAHRPTGGSVFLASFKKLTPWFLGHVVPTAKTISSASKKRLRDVYVADDSLTNCSSIVAIVEGGAKRLLLLGDAWAEDIAAELRRTHGGDNFKLFDAIKVSHHGSLRNTSVDLLSLIDAPLFLISTNGSGHDHPDFEVLAEIVDRPAAFERIIILQLRDTSFHSPESARIEVRGEVQRAHHAERLDSGLGREE